MPEKRWNKARKCFVYYPRLFDENGNRRIVGAPHASKRVAKQYELKARNEIAERKMFPERFSLKVKLSGFIPDYLKKHASKKRSYRDYVSICQLYTDLLKKSFMG